MSQHIVSSTTLAANATNVTYTPQSQWFLNYDPSGVYRWYQNTDTYSGLNGSSVTLNFYGNAVEYWSNRNNQHGPCAISLDNQYIENVNSYSEANTGPYVLYSATGLTLGDHTLGIEVVNGSATGSTGRCEVDRFVVNITSSDVAVTSSPSATNTASSQSSKSSSKAGTIGGVLSGLAVLCLLVFLFWWYRRRTRQAPDTDPIVSPFTQPDMSSTIPTSYMPSEPRSSSSAYFSAQRPTKGQRLQNSDQRVLLSPGGTSSGTANTRELSESAFSEGIPIGPPPSYHG